MKKFIRSLSSRAEFTFVIGLAFGYAIIISVLRWWGFVSQKTLTDNNLLVLAIFELALGTVLISFLWLRDWRPRKIGLIPTFKDTGIGLLLLAATTVIWIATLYLVYFITPATVMGMRDTAAQLKGPYPPSVAILVGVSLINATFEEIFVSGYIITALKPARGPAIAVGASVMIRVLYHLYQGRMAFLGIAPLGLVYAIWFVRTGRLWPLVVAHVLQDIAALMV